MKFDKCSLLATLLFASTTLIPLPTSAEETSSIKEQVSPLQTDSIFNEIPSQSYGEHASVPPSNRDSTLSKENTESSTSFQEKTTTDQSTKSTDKSITHSSKKNVEIEEKSSLRENSNNILNDWSYTDQGSYIQLNKYTGDNTEIVVPSEYNGKPIKLKSINSTIIPNYASITSFKVLPKSDGTKIEVLNSELNMAFSGFKNLTTVDLSGLDTSNVTSMNSMFNDCPRLTSLNLNGLNTSNVRNMAFMFYGCISLTSLDLSSFNTSNVITMYRMFNNCTSLTSLNLSNFNTSNVTNMGVMFSDCRSLTSLDLSSFNTSNVTNMDFMFYRCNSLTSLDLSNFDLSKTKNMKSMFVTNTYTPSLITANDNKLLTYNYVANNRIPLNTPSFDPNGGQFKDGTNIKKTYFNKVAYPPTDFNDMNQLIALEKFKNDNVAILPGKQFSGWKAITRENPNANNIFPDLQNVEYQAQWTLIDTNTPSDENIKTGELSSYGIAYIPRQFNITKTLLKEEGKQSIPFEKSNRFDIGIRDVRNTPSSWTLSARLEWDNEKELIGSSIQTTNKTGIVMKNINNGLNNFDPKKDLVSSNNEVYGMSNVKITSNQFEPIISTNNVSHSAVYNYNLGNVSLDIAETKIIQPGQYTGYVNWNLSDVPR